MRFGDFAAQCIRFKYLNVGCPTEDETNESASARHAHLDGGRLWRAAAFVVAAAGRVARFFDQALRGVERALAEDTRCRIPRAQPDGNARAVNAVETVCGEIVAEVKTGRACETFVCVVQRTDMVYREWDDVAPQMIIAD